MSLAFHPAAELFPLMGDAEVAELAEDIRVHGLRVPIMLHPDGSILDGRNRYRACQIANAAMRFETWSGDSEASLVLSLNLHRRHLSESQRAMVGARAKSQFESEALERQKAGTLAFKKAKGRSAQKAAELVNVSRSSVEQADRVLRRGAPGLVEQVDGGEISLARAAKVARVPADEQLRILLLEKAELRKAIQELPTEANARKIARETGLATLDRSGYYRGPGTKQDEEKAMRELSAILALTNSIAIFSETTYTPASLAAAVKPGHCRHLEQKLLTAQRWLGEFYLELDRNGKISKIKAV